MSRFDQQIICITVRGTYNSAFDSMAADDMVVEDPSEDEGLGTEVTFFVCFGALLFGYPFFRWVRARYLTVLAAKISDLSSSVVAND